MIDEQEILRRVVLFSTLQGMEARGWTVAIEYVPGCYEWVLSVNCGPDTTIKSPNPPDLVVSGRHANPERAWRLVVIQLQDRQLFPL